jgi:hypothetical protein
MTAILVWIQPLHDIAFRNCKLSHVARQFWLTAWELSCGKFRIFIVANYRFEINAAWTVPIWVRSKVCVQYRNVYKQGRYTSRLVLFVVVQKISHITAQKTDISLYCQTSHQMQFVYREKWQFLCHVNEQKWRLRLKMRVVEPDGGWTNLSVCLFEPRL